MRETVPHLGLLCREALDRFEIGRELVGGQASGGSIATEDTVPAPLEAVRGEGEARGDVCRFPIEFPWAEVSGGSGHGELCANKKAVSVRSRFAEEFAMKVLELELLSFRVFAPRNKESSAAGIVRVGQKAKPVEIRGRSGAFGVGPELLV